MYTPKMLLIIYVNTLVILTYVIQAMSWKILVFAVRILNKKLSTIEG